MTIDVHFWDGFNSFLLAAEGLKTKVPPPSEGPNFFDAIVLVMLIIGMVRGKVRGISQELFDVCKWLLFIVVTPLCYKFLGDFVAKNTPIPLVIDYVGCYLFIVVVVHSIFNMIKDKMGEKIFKSDLFGRGEYPLGMLAGAVRYAAMTLVFLAVMNAFVMDYAQVEIKKKAHEKDLGEGMAFPTKEGMHQGIFINSMTGKFVKGKLENLLIKETEYASAPETAMERQSKEREKNLQRIINSK